jgi:hypothetical protein
LVFAESLTFIILSRFVLNRAANIQFFTMALGLRLIIKLDGSIAFCDGEKGSVTFQLSNGYTFYIIVKPTFIIDGTKKDKDFSKKKRDL